MERCLGTLTGILALLLSGSMALSGSVALAEDKPPQAVRSAQQIVRVLGEGDEKVLRFYVGLDWPDPWLVAFHLCAHGEHDVARKLATVAKREDLTLLAKRLAHWKQVDDARMVELERLSEAKDWKALAKHCERRSGSETPFESAWMAYSLSWARLQLGDLTGTVQAAERAEREALKIGWLLGAARALSNKGHALRRLEDFEGTLEAWRRSVLLHDRRLGYVSGARMRGDIAALYVELDDARPAIELLDYAVDVFRKYKGHGARVADRLASLHNLGWARLVVGPFSNALSAFEEMQTVATEANRPRASVDARLGIATVLIRTGDWDRAERTIKTAIDDAKKSEYELGVARGLGTLGLLRVESRDAEEASGLYEQARDAFQEIAYDEEQPASARRLAKRHTATATVNAASAYLELGELDVAVPLFEHTLETHDRYPAVILSAQEGMARAAFKGGDPKRALELYEKARKRADLMGQVDAQLGIYTGMAEAQLALKRWTGAVQSVKRAMAILAHAIRHLGHAQQSKARARRALLYQIGLTAAAELEDATVFSEILESSRAYALMEMLEDPELLRETLIPKELRDQEQKLQTRVAVARRRMQAALRTGDLKRATAYRKELRTAEEDVTQVVAKIQRAAKAGADLLYPSALSLELIRETLLPGDVLIRYAMLPDATYALVTRKSGAYVRRLGDTDELNALIVELLEKIANQEDVHPTLVRIAKLILIPLEIAGSQRVMISPDGLLHYVPLSMVLNGGDLLYVPSGTALHRLAGMGARKETEILALGNPTYPDGSGLSPLPLTKKEATKIGTKTLLGKQATESRLVQALREQERWRAVHFACHGRLDYAHPSRSHLALTADEASDGHLTAEEIFGMKIPARLVVLSACNTGKGEILGAEGMVGLTTAFMVAGASRTLCSLWKVNDKATAALMEQFYAHWKRGASMNTALERARDYVRRQPGWEHPYYWGAWVFWGMPD